MGISDATGKSIEWVKNGGKKKLAAHGATASGAVLATILAIQQIFGPLSGLAEIAELKKKADTTVVIATKMENIEKVQEKQDAKLETIQSLLIQMAAKQGVKTDTVTVYRDSTDTTVARTRPR